MTWPLVQLKDCARIVGGATPKSEIADYWNGDIPWTTPKDLSDLDGKFLADTPRKITEQGLRNCSSEVLPPNSVLFSSRAPIGHVAINTVPMATNQGFKSMVPGPKLDASFLYWWLKCHRPQLEQLGNGATFKEVSKAVVERIEMPLPPLEEQRRVAAILDQADELRRKRRRAIDRLNQLGQAIFIEMFGDPSEDSYSSRVTTIGSAQDAGIIVAIQDGNHGEKHPKVSDFVSEGIPFVMANCMADGEIRLEKSYKLDPNWRKILRVGFAMSLDVLLSHKGTIGQTAVVPEDVDQLILSPQVTYYRLSESLDPYFLQAYFDSVPFQRAMKKDSVQSTRAYIGITRQRELPILIPELGEQIEFRRRVLKLREIRADALAAASSQLSLFKSLQARAFNGELTAPRLKQAAA